jgi:hypothetical protein
LLSVTAKSICDPDQGEAFFFSLTVFVFVFYQAGTTGYMLLQEDRRHREEQLVDTEDGAQYSRQVIRTLWDWNCTDTDAIEDAKMNAAEGLLLIKREEEHAAEIKVRLLPFSGPDHAFSRETIRNAQTENALRC